jgi:putative nucleotidyltransferase with HDIG domain
MSQFTNTVRPATPLGHHAAQNSVDRWVGLSNLNRYLLGSNTLSDLLERATRSVVEILDLNYAKVILLESDGQYYWKMIYQEGDGAVECPDHVPVSVGVEKFLKKVALTYPALKPLKVDNKAIIQEHQSISGKEFLHIWLVPLSVNQQQIGFLELGSLGVKESNLYLINSTHLVELMAGQLANGIFRIKLNERLSNTSSEMVRALTKALVARDVDSGLHSQNMATISDQVARKMGCTDAECQIIYWAALLHDIGKIGVEDKVLHKPGKLTPEEWEAIHKHPEIGAKIVQGMTGLDEVAPLILAHHERLDGSGYPLGLRGNQIPLGARIIAVVDTFSAVIEGRAYQPKRFVQDAIDILVQQRGIQFDAEVVDTLINLIQERSFII